ncbi:MAG: glycosyltransferase family 2 protein [Pedosphaera sp.]|nr:glycosyltransferase family 2 protein [Pedosphaera sp.]
MSQRVSNPRLTLCVLTFSEHFRLAKRTLESIWSNCDRADFRLIVGANAAGADTLSFLSERHRSRDIDELIVSPTNLSKCPMMRRMFANITTEYIWWFDDDSFITDPGALSQWILAAEAAPKLTVIWGALGQCDHRLAFTDVEDITGFVRSAGWYRGLPPPSWRPGGKGELDFADRARVMAGGSSSSGDAG